MSDVYYVIRSNQNGKYLTARIPKASNSLDLGNPSQATSYLLVFLESYQALSYINQHGVEFQKKLAVETVIKSQLNPLIKRWNFQGLALVRDPLVPDIEFLKIQ